MSKKKNDRKTKKLRKHVFFSRRGSTLVLVLAVMILIVSIVSLSFSWFSPASQPGTSMNYNTNIRVRSENCEISGTYAAVDENDLPMSQKTGNIVYSNTKVTSATIERKVDSGSLESEQIYYFKTVIENKDPQPTNVSLYLNTLPTQIGGATPPSEFPAFGLGVALPSNSYHTFSSVQRDVCIVRNAYIRGRSDEKYKDLTVEWFIKVKGPSVTVNFSNNNLYLRYN